VKPLTEQDLAAIESEARRLASSGAALDELLGQSLPRIVAALRAARGEAESLGSALEKEKARHRAAEEAPRPAPAPSRDEAVEETESAGAFLAAPFRVSAQAAAAARTDPLAALAVQVAKALSPDASPVEKARLIAMAFAASQGDLEAFWAARKQRKLAPKTSR
jgi:hypothetical protein